MTESSRTRSDSLEASNSQQDRKRPRLDPGNNDNLQSEEALTDSTFLEISQDPDSLTNTPTGGTCLNNYQSPSSPSDSSMKPSSNGPLSKVTINTRATTTNISDAPDISSDLPEGIQGSEKSLVEVNATPLDSISDSDNNNNNNMVAIPPDTITIHSSPSQSPEIQIAVVEDIDQDPAETNWTPVTRLTDSVLLQEQATPYYVRRTFPYAHGTPVGSVHEILGEVGKVFLQGSLTIQINESGPAC